MYYSPSSTFLGDITISDSVTYTEDSDVNGASPQFTLTCISTGGPATTVTWTRDSDIVTDGTETVLDNPVTAQYTHTLTVTGRLGELYTHVLCLMTSPLRQRQTSLLKVNMLVCGMLTTVGNSIYTTTINWKT